MMSYTKRDLSSNIGKANSRKESIRLLSNKEFMDSYKMARKQIKKRNFADWDELQGSTI